MNENLSPKLCVCVFQEQKELLEKGFNNRADVLEKEIQRLRGEIKHEEQSKQSTLSKIVDGVGTAASLFLPGIIPKTVGFFASLFSRFF